MRSEAQFRTQVRMVVADDADIGQLSTGERIAVAFVLNRPDLLEQYWGSMLEFRRSSRHRLDSRRPARPAQRLLASMTRRESSLNSPSTYVLDSHQITSCCLLDILHKIAIVAYRAMSASQLIGGDASFLQAVHNSARRTVYKRC